MAKITNTGSKPAVSERSAIVSILKGLAASYIITIPAFMLFALILANTDFPQRYVTPAVVVTTVVSVLTAGSVASKGIGSKGWLNGSIVGLIYMMILYLVSSLVYNNFAINKYVITMALIGVLTGAIGGIVGINTKKGSKYKYIGG